MYTLPNDTAPCIEAAGILSNDQRKVPHASVYKAKLRSMGFHIVVAAGDTNVGKTKILLGFLPAGRNRVIFELSSLNGSATVSGAIMAAKYITGDRAEVQVPAHAISGAVTKGAFMVSLSKNEGATIIGDKEYSRPSWGFKYESLEDIPIYIACSALAAGNEIHGSIVYGQE